MVIIYAYENMCTNLFTYKNNINKYSKKKTNILKRMLLYSYTLTHKDNS